MAKLIKVAKHFNIGTSTVVEFLSSKGFDIESKPTAKVTDEMYQLLENAYSSSAEVKEEADKLTMGNKQEKPVEIPVAPPVVEEVKEEVKQEVKEEEKTPVVEEVKEEVAVVEEEPVVVATPLVEEKKEEPVVKEEEKQTDSSIGLKIKGKIDLDQFNKPKKKAKETPKKLPVQEKKKEKPKTKPAQISDKKKPAKEKLVYRSKLKGAKVIDEEGASINTGHVAVKEDIIRASTPTLGGLKIKGKIDISKLEKSSKPKKSTSAKPGTNTAGKRKRTRTVRKVVHNRPYSRGKNDFRKGTKKGGKAEVKELTKKEIDDQIKATMARLSGGGKNKRQKIRRDIRESKKEKQELIDLENVETTLKLTEFITVSELASLMDVTATDVITTCMNLGVFVSINQRLDAEIIELVAGEFGHEVEFISVEETVIEEEEEIDDPADLIPRAPIVTIMGHVDHGKTSLLDYIRKANVADGEAGGITQHIGAYKVKTKVGDEEREITFLDTPGHEAFTAMRARGAKVTDIAVIIIAADDKIMPQTKEAISHAQAAGVPIVFAINKIDKDGASPERIKQELASMNLLIEEWGGKFQSQDISAKEGINIELLLEKIILESDMLELKANPKAKALGSIIEASLDKGKGYTAKVLIKNGTLNIGDPMSVGKYYGKVKALIDGKGNRIKSAGPATPVMVLGLNGAPQAGETIKEYESEKDAKDIAKRREQLSREQSLRTTKRISLEEIGRRLALGTFKELNLIIKGDVDGSVEALTDSLEKLSVETVTVNVIHKAVGSIIESDILLAAASDAIIIGFQVRPSAGVRNLAEKEEVQIKTYSIIYEAIEDITDAIEGLLEPTKEERVLAQVRVQEVYKISKVGTIAGCLVEEGTVGRNNHIRLIRDGIVVYPNKEGVIGEMSSLKRYKDDVKEVKSGMECGLSIHKYNDIKVDDIIEVYEVIEIEQKLKRK